MRKRLAAAAAASVLCLVATAFAQHRSDKPRKKSAAQVARAKVPSPVDYPFSQPKISPAQHRAEALEEARRYKGIDVDVQGGVDLATRRVQSAAARLLERLDYVPEHRLGIFRSLTDGGTYTISGWHGNILQSRAVEDGMIFTLMVRARFGSSSIGTAVHVIETYLYTPDGRIEHLGSVAPEVTKVTTTN